LSARVLAVPSPAAQAHAKFNDMESPAHSATRVSAPARDTRNAARARLVRVLLGTVGALAACQAPGAPPAPPAPDAAGSDARRPPPPDAAPAPEGDGSTGGTMGNPDTAPGNGGVEGGPPAGPAALDSIIPRPVMVSAAPGSFALTATTRIVVEPASAELMAIGRYLADRLRPATGFPLTVAAAGGPSAGDIRLTTQAGDPTLGDEGYQLQIAPEGVTVTAFKPAGVFRGLQTIRQLLPADIERASAQAGPWTLTAGSVRDQPRFVWRGAMLDLARHFFGVEIVKRFIDLLVYYKMNRLHLHLSDDQGWRIAIEGWPRLTSVGGTSEVGGGPGGFLSKQQYAEIVTYAQERYVTVVPEIDVPGHTNAALASYPELNCNGMAPPLYTGVNVGFSTLCIGTPATDRFMADVIRELAAMTPGPYIHLGGDEAMSTKPDEYVTFISAMQKLVKAAGKEMIGWEEVAAIADLSPTSLVQHWANVPMAMRAKQQGAKLIMSPASRAYLDMKYDATTPVGGTWAGFIDERKAYEWDPATQIPGIAEADIVGVEAPLWSETISTREQVEYLLLPRVAGYAEIAWSPPTGRTWDEYRTRLGNQGPRLTAMGANAYRSALVPWK
jgi:hexosaminidase